MKSMSKGGRADLKSLFERLNEAYSRLPNPVFYRYRIGPFSVCLAFAGDSLIDKIGKAFSHLEQSEPLSTDLTICLWDTSATKQKLPSLDWNLIHQNGYRGYSAHPYYFHYFSEIEALSALNMEQNRAYYVVKDADALPWWVSGSPLQVLLHVWFREQGLQLTHTAAVSDGKNGLLLTGKGGSGKSTTTLSCLAQGLYSLGEDYCLLSAKTSEVFSVYQTAKWNPHTRTLFPQYERWIANPAQADREKALIYYQDIFPGKIKASAPLVAIVSLQVSDQEMPLLEECTPQDGLKSLMMSTLLQLPHYQTDTINILKELSSKMRHYRLILGQNLNANVELIRRILK